MIGSFLQSITSPLIQKLDTLAKNKNVTPLHMTLITVLCAVLSITLFGLQYFWTALLFFILYCASFALYSKQKQDQTNKDIPFASYLVVTSSMMALLWTSAGFSIPIAFMFWAMLINILANIKFDPKLKIIDLAELSLILIAMAASPFYIPAIALLTGIMCLISSTAAFIQSLKTEQ